MMWLVSSCIARKIEARPVPKPERDLFFWASETEHGIWRVQFEADKYGMCPVFDNVKADTCWEAAESVRPLNLSAE